MAASMFLAAAKQKNLEAVGFLTVDKNRILFIMVIPFKSAAMAFPGVSLQ